ncbi:MAG: CooT family nickel-binding protein [Lachnospiraceae bacterium]|jgi:predicted RNA-binding protein|nr:CooT family nickel-binding protein [Lachnospiraceae bacterium]
MCLSTVYLVKSNQEKELLCKNVASITRENNQLILKNVLGIPTTVKGEIAHVDLVENFVYVRPTEQA